MVTFFGDGAANRGPFHEGVNMAALWKLPVVFVCENNRWASTTAHDLSTAGGSIAARAAGYGIPGDTIDGNDVLTVWRRAMTAVERARRGDGPSLIEAHDSVGAWLAWVVMEDCFDDLDAPIARVAGPNTPIPFSPPLEAFATPDAEDVIAAVRTVLK